MLGYSKAELEGTRIIDFARADFENHWQELQENLWARQIPSFRFETVLIRKDGFFSGAQLLPPYITMAMIH
jgi:PAS domain-containing protein